MSRKLESLIARLAEAHLKTEEAQRKTEEAQRKTERSIDRLGEAQRKTEEAHLKTEEFIRELQRTEDESRKELRKQLGGMGQTQGEIAEDLFFRSTGPLCDQEPYNLHFDHIFRRLYILDSASKYAVEFDIFAINDTCVLAVEVKSKLKEQDVRDFLKKLSEFRIHNTEYKRYRILGGVAGLSIRKEVEQFAEKHGLFVFTQNGNGGAEIANTAGFKPHIY